MVNKYIQYKQYIKQQQEIKRIELIGVKFIYKKSKVKLILGGACLVIAIIPNGLGLVFYPLGFALLSSAGIDLYALIQSKKRKLRVFIQGISRGRKC